jgi:hypothetical protein
MIRYALIFLAIAKFVGLAYDAWRMFNKPPPAPPPPAGSVKVLLPGSLPGK